VASLIKVVAVRATIPISLHQSSFDQVVGFCILGALISGGAVGDQGYLGATYWHDPGAFNHGFKGVCSALVMAAFAFGGTEMVGLTAAEMKNPRRAMPTAVKHVFWRIVLVSSGCDSSL
jgi:yeast amino acid transporter